MTDSTTGPTGGPSEIPAEDGGHLRHDTPTAPFVTADAPPAASGDSFRRRDRRGVLVPVLVAAVVAALIGGGVGAGITLAVNPRSSVSTSAAGPQGVVINNPSTATAVSAVAAKASPSVVTISVTAPSEAGTGSGIVLTSDGYVLTNNHVVTLGGDTSTGTISVTTSDGRIYKAKIVGTDPLNDLAVIRLTNASGLTAATFADSSDLNVGDAVVAIGAPLDLPNTVTTGIVSALNRSINVASSAVKDNSGDSGTDGSDSPFNFWDNGGDTQQPTATSQIYLSVLQTDAAINPGNSGGALLDAQGDVIGVNVAIAGAGSSTGEQSGNIGVGFSIPSNVAKRIADDLIAGKTASHGQLGVSSLPDQSTSTGTIAGVEVAKVTSGGAAAKAGIEKGDIITAVGKVPVTDYTDLAGQVRAYAGGTTVDVTYSRGGTQRTVAVTLETIKA